MVRQSDCGSFIVINVFFYRSHDFHPAFDRIRDLRAFVPCGVPVLAAEKLDMVECCVVSVGPNKKNILFEGVIMSMYNIEDDFAPVVKDLAENNIRAERVLVYCRSLDMCSNFKLFVRSLSLCPGREKLLPIRC